MSMTKPIAVQACSTASEPTSSGF